MTRTCKGCGTPLPPPKSMAHRPQKWCSQRCRQSQYAGVCESCGKPTTGNNGPGKAPKLCRPCFAREMCAARRIWTRELVVARIQEWTELYGEPPAQTDWNPYSARLRHDEDRARRFEDAEGYWPGFTTPINLYGSWNEAIRAAGFEPRALGRPRRAVA